MDKDNLFSELMEGLTKSGMEFVPQVLPLLFNAAMEIERSNFLRAMPYERSDNRKGYANGFKPKTLSTRIGKMTLQIPQVRNLEFYPQSVEKGARSERALKTALAQMYISGVSTRRVKEITEALCGTEVSSTQVSNVTKLLDDELNAFRKRKLGQFHYLVLDAKYEKVRVINKWFLNVCSLLLELISKGIERSCQLLLNHPRPEPTGKNFLKISEIAACPVCV